MANATTVFAPLLDRVPDGIDLKVLTSVALSAGVVAVLYAQLSRKSDGFNYLPGLPIVGSWSFFTRRFDFLNAAVDAQRDGKLSKFKLLNVGILCTFLPRTPFNSFH